jgi:hypothetical protein
MGWLLQGERRYRLSFVRVHRADPPGDVLALDQLGDAELFAVVGDAVFSCGDEQGWKDSSQYVQPRRGRAIRGYEIDPKANRTYVILEGVT